MHAHTCPKGLLPILALAMMLASTMLAPAGIASAATSRIVVASQPTGVVSGLDVQRVPGVTEAVGRSFDSFTPEDSSGIGHLEFAVLAFADASTAQSALPEVFPALTSVLRQDAQPVEPPDLGDEALAWTASGPEDFTIATLIVRDDALVHLLVAVAQSGDPVAAVNAIAERTIGRTPDASPVATPAADARPLQTGGLWDFLPRYDDLPGSFGLYTEESWPSAPIPGVPSPPSLTACQVEPRPASDFENLAGAATPGAMFPPSTPAPITSIPDGEPADPATINAVTAVVREHIACIALGDWPRAYSLVTDDFLAAQLGQAPPELIDFLLSDEGMVPIAEGPRLAEVRDVVLLPDGRAGAVVEIVTVFNREVTRETSFIWLSPTDDGFLIDRIAGIEATDVATPASD